MKDPRETLGVVAKCRYGLDAMVAAKLASDQIDALADAGLAIVPEAELQRLRKVETTAAKLFTVQEQSDG